MPIMNTTLYSRIVRSAAALAVCCSPLLSSAATVPWIGNPGVTTTTNWSDLSNWSGGGPTGNDALFGNTGAAGSAGTITSVADVDQHPLSLAFTNGANQFHTVYIPAGVTVSNDNALNVGVATVIDANLTTVWFAGPGTLFQKGNMTVRNNSAGQGASLSLATLDLSSLTNFVYTNSSGTIAISGTGSETRAGGALTLAGGSNNIVAATINFNTTSGNVGNNAGSVFKLGLGTNIINVGNLNVVAGKVTSGTMSFQGATGGLRFRGVSGNSDDTSRGNITICNRNSGGTGGMNGTVDFTGHRVDIKANNIVICISGSNPTSAGQNGTGTLTFDTGIIDCNAINMASNGVANSTTTGNLNVNGGTLTVGSGGISVLNQFASTATGNLTVNAATLQTSGNIRKGSAGGVATISVTSSSLKLTGGTNSVGSVNPIDTLNLTDTALTVPVASGSPAVSANTLNVSGTSNLINIASVPGLGTFPVITYSSLGGSYNFVLGTLPGTFQGYLANNPNSVDLVITNSLAKTDVWNGNVNTNWDTATANWLFTGSPSSFAQGDNAIFDNTATGTTNVYLTTSLLPATVTSDNSSKSYVFYGPGKLSGSMALTKQGTGSLTLAETGGDDFSGGVVVNDGTLILDNANSAIAGGLTVNGGTVQIGNNDTNGALPGGTVTVNESLVFAKTNSVLVGVPISGTGSLTQKGSGGTLTLSGANNYSGATTVTNGTLVLTGAGTIANSAQAIITGGTLDVSALTGPAAVTALSLTNSTINISIRATAYTNVVASSLAIGGATNRISVAALPPIASYPVTFTILQSAAAADGTFNIGVGTLPVATPSYAANVSQSLDHTLVYLTVTAGPIGVRTFLTWSGADVPNLNTNWSDALNWYLPGAPTGPEAVIFNNAGAYSVSALSTPGGGASALVPDNINNIVNSDFTINSLLFTNVADTYHNTYLNPGRKLSVTNSLTLGAFDSGASAQHEFVTVSGNGGLNSSNTAGNLQVWIGSGSVGGSQATLDMSALDTFNASVSRFLVGATINNVVNRPSGIVYLAKTNTIAAGFQTTTITNGTTTANAGIVVADCNQNAGSRSFLYLGQVNNIFADTIGIGRQKAGATLAFNSTYANIAPYPTLTLRGFSTSRASILEIGDSLGNTGTTSLSADADLRGGVVDASVDILTVGRASSGGTSGTTTGSLEFDAGTINANTLNIGFLPAPTTKVGVGTVGVGSNTIIGAAATLRVNGVANLGQTPGGTSSSATSGTLNITNGTVFANSIVPGTNSSSTIGMYGGRLFATNAIGSAATPLVTLNLLPSTPDNARNDLYLSADGNPSITVNTLNLDEQDTTTNVIHVLSVGPVGTPPVELALIKYGTLSPQVGSTFNIGLGSLPAGYSGYLTNDTDQLMVGLVLTSAIHPRPVMTGLSLSGTNLVIAGTNGFANFPYRVVSSTNVSDPLSTWTVIGSGVFGPTGNFNFSTPVVPAVPQRFYSVVVP